MPKAVCFIQRLRTLVGDSITTAGRPQHRRQRRMIQPAFHTDRHNHYARIMVEETKAALETWPTDESVEIYPAMQQITTRIAARTMFACPMEPEVIDESCRALGEIISGSGTRMILPSPLARIATPGKRTFDGARRRMRNITNQLVAEYKSSGRDHHDLLSLLLFARDEEGRPLSQQEITNQVITIFLGGVETTASTLGWCLTLLASHPDIEERVHNEVTSLLRGQVPTVEDLDRLPLVKGTVLESLRLHPPGWLLTRVTNSVATLGGQTIPAGITVIYSPYLIHRLPSLFPNPEKFDPSRWSNNHRIPRGGFIPFGAGSRQCIGDNFTMIEVPLVLAMLAACYRIAPCPSSPSPTRRIQFLHVPSKMCVRATKAPIRPGVPT
ncbi:cytochrome P450 [Streptomyces sp. NPDC058086]|uniref:cytochrome P450 n=1 Tax=Streptomyces sp. NPDC058086 TaxID=3346334 RepID=UPI0036EC0720